MLQKKNFTVEMDNDSKHTTKPTQEFLKAKKRDIIQWPSQSPDLILTEYVFSY